LTSAYNQYRRVQEKGLYCLYDYVSGKALLSSITVSPSGVRIIECSEDYLWHRSLTILFSKLALRFIKKCWCNISGGFYQGWYSEERRRISVLILEGIFRNCFLNFARAFSTRWFCSEVGMNIGPLRRPRFDGNFDLFLVNAPAIANQHVFTLSAPHHDYHWY